LEILNGYTRLTIREIGREGGDGLNWLRIESNDFSSKDGNEL
jgi:hypothetical protein